MIELYHNDMSVCAQKVRFALGEKELDWKSHHLNLRAGDQQKPEYVRLKPWFRRWWIAAESSSNPRVLTNTSTMLIQNRACVRLMPANGAHATLDQAA